VKLINEVENNWDTLIIGAKGLKVANEMSSGEIDFREFLIGAAPTRNQPARRNPVGQHCGFDPNLCDNLIRMHD
jgi:hypothetical protein